MNNRLSLTAQAHNIIQSHLIAGDIAIDATIGNGHDTVFLCKQVGLQGKIFGFDIQQQAIDETNSKLNSENLPCNVNLFLCSHSEMDTCIPLKYHKQIKIIVFNLGYLPGSDKSITTETESTIIALKKSLKLLASDGLMTIIAYPGHSSGAIENDQLIEWCHRLDHNYFCVKIIDSSNKPTAPRLFIISKL